MFIINLMNWLALIVSLPTANTAGRMRVWRALQAAGVWVMRDGVYVLPAQSACAALFEDLAQQVRGASGSAHVVQLAPTEGVSFEAHFDRSADYAAVLADLEEVRRLLAANRTDEARRQIRKSRKAFSAVVATDYFPGEAQRQTEAQVLQTEAQVAQASAPGEPRVMQVPVKRCDVSQYQQRVWATRARPWVDRLACAWLIRRFIDPQAQFVWLQPKQRCPAQAVGFDFDGASFSHVPGRVSFEVLLASFGLERAPLLRLGALVHFLDVGGVEPPQAAGVETVLAGLRSSIANDDQLLAAASMVFDGLVQAFEQGTAIE